MGEHMAIIKAGRVNTNLTRNAAFSTSENATAIRGSAGEMVITDIIVRLLTRRSVSFVFHFYFPWILFSLGVIPIISQIMVKTKLLVIFFHYILSVSFTAGAFIHLLRAQLIETLMHAFMV